MTPSHSLRNVISEPASRAIYTRCWDATWSRTHDRQGAWQATPEPVRASAVVFRS